MKLCLTATPKFICLLFLLLIFDFTSTSPSVEFVSNTGISIPNSCVVSLFSFFPNISITGPNPPEYWWVFVSIVKSVSDIDVFKLQNTLIIMNKFLRNDVFCFINLQLIRINHPPYIYLIYSTFAIVINLIWIVKNFLWTICR